MGMRNDFDVVNQWGQIWGQPMDRVLSSLIFLGLLGYPDFDPRLALEDSKKEASKSDASFCYTSAL